KKFKALRRLHTTVESDINCLEHHGLNKCPDKGMPNFRKYTSIGVVAYSLHKLGNILIKEDRIRLSKNKKIPIAA
ncbi:ISNCY family transposase, partial [candidate division KSB1 bacterium]|nr:ISNCY family transposase [candidate division KSB1 bacterium]